MKRKLLRQRKHNSDIQWWENLGNGVGAALVGVLVTNPADVIKTRLMTQAASVEVPYTSTIDCLSTLLKKGRSSSIFCRCQAAKLVYLFAMGYELFTQWHFSAVAGTRKGGVNRCYHVTFSVT